MIVAERRSNAIAKINEYCPDCKVDEGDYPTTDLSKAGQPTFSGTLNSNPSGTTAPGTTLSQSRQTAHSRLI